MKNPKTVDRSKTAFVCGGCGAKAWGKPVLWIACIECQLPMKAVG